MPPKRKASARTATDKAAEPGKPKSAKTSTRSSPRLGGKENATAAGSKTQGVKFSNPDTLSEKPDYIVLTWPKDHETDTEDKDRDVPKNVPKDQPLGEKWTHRVSDLGYPMSRDGLIIRDKLQEEQEKRDQDLKGMHIYNDWNGWGFNEILINILKDFNRDIYKKTLSPYKKWAYIEGIAAFLKSTSLDEWMMNDDSDTIRAIMNMFGTMILTSFEMLAEHGLFTPDSRIKNIAIISLLWLEFIDQNGEDLDISWACEVVRLCDEAGFDLTESLRGQIDLDNEKFETWRKGYGEKKKCQEAEDGDGYKYWAGKTKWKPQDDWKDDVRQWYRWDWKVEYNEFKKDNPGGSHYDLTKMSRAERDMYTFGTAANDARFAAMMDSDLDSDDD